MKEDSKYSPIRKKQSINIGGKLLDLSSTVIMGILNTTPDSFYDGGKYQNPNDILNRAETIINEGADIIDIGGVSTRPGADYVSEDEEIRRVLPAIIAIKKKFPERIISIDTFRSSVVDRIFSETGPVIINDISGGNFDSAMFETVGRLNLPYILMHMPGDLNNMHVKPQYKNISNDIIKYFVEKVDKLISFGVKDIIIDPGFGFGKTLENNYELLRRLEDFKILELPLLVGLSRKSMIYKPLGINPEETLSISTMLHGFAIDKGANILRVHDVKEAVNAIKIMNLYI